MIYADMGHRVLGFFLSWSRPWSNNLYLRSWLVLSGNIDVVCKNIIVLICPVFYVHPNSKTFITVYLCLSCEIALYLSFIVILVVAVWCSGSSLVTINVVNLHQARLVLGWVRTRSHPLGFNQLPRPTQPGHPSGVDKMSTGVKTGNFSGIE